MLKETHTTHFAVTASLMGRESARDGLWCASQRLGLLAIVALVLISRALSLL